MDCTKMKKMLPELLMDRELPQVRAHVNECVECRRELSELEATMALMDAWQAPEPSPWWQTQMQARLREEMAAEPAGLFERLRARILYGTNFKLRPVAVSALSLVLLVGGGIAYLEVPGPQPPQASAAVHGLQTLDHDQQLFDQLEQMGQDSNNNGD